MVRGVVRNDTKASGFVIALLKDVCRSASCGQLLIYVLPIGVDLDMNKGSKSSL